jgi:hypothetical protein
MKLSKAPQASKKPDTLLIRSSAAESEFEKDRITSVQMGRRRLQ